jgi:hypothetical protein
VSSEGGFLTTFTKMSALRTFCLSIDSDLSDSLWAKVVALPKSEWTEESVRLLVKPKKTSKKVKKDGDKKE